MNEVREKFAHLRRLREDLQNAVLRWIVIREATKQKLKSLAMHLKAFESEVHILEQAASSLLYPFLPIGPFITVAGIRAAIIGKNKEIVLSLGLSEVQTSIEEDRKSCLELQQQLDSLENFISTLAEFLMPLNHNMVLLKEMGESGFEFLYKWIACEDVGPSTVTKVEFCAKFLRAATSAPTMSSSIPDQCLLPFLFLKLLGQTPWLALRLDVRLSAQGHARNTLLTVVLILNPILFLLILLCSWNLLWSVIVVLSL